jgi:hypothetical protein
MYFMIPSALQEHGKEIRRNRSKSALGGKQQPPFA